MRRGVLNPGVSSDGLAVVKVVKRAMAMAGRPARALIFVQFESTHFAPLLLIFSPRGRPRRSRSQRATMKYVVVSGGVVSGLGKGVTISSVGRMLQGCGLRVTSIKIDPYLNVDAGTMSPFEHGEVRGHCLVAVLCCAVLFCLALAVLLCIMCRYI